jgi:ABC-type multidrug transport system fused ATPase/permease subunit
VFSSTIRENITLAQDFSDADIAHAMDVARFTDVLPSLPNGLDSVVNEKGVNLSGGQKQRLALARALLFSQNKSLLLLDESTSSVDPDNEAKIYEKIFEWWNTSTALLFSIKVR